MSKLAILGGRPIRKNLFPAHNTIGEQEISAVTQVLRSGNLSQFLGAWHEDFFGGPKVREFEANWGSKFGAKYCVSVNSNTSGLIAAVGAVGIQAGDEVVVSPYTMTASAIAPFIYGGVPVFADIDPDIFCISADSIRKVLSPRTKAILVVHIFGHPADMDPIMALAKEHGLAVIEDCAQVPGATYKGRPVGTIGDIGIFSLNYHKHIHTGEGGMVVTQSADLAERLQLIRNHGENVVGPKGVKNIHNTHGYNFRLPEIEAAIGIEQLKKLDSLLEERIENAAFISKHTSDLGFITPPAVKNNSKHVYYQHANKYHANLTGVHRNIFVKALQAELPSAHLRETTPILGAGYVRPLYLQPIYQTRKTLCSFNCPRYEGEPSYNQGICPVTENMHFETLFTHEFIRPGMNRDDLNDVVAAFQKVAENIGDLKGLEK